MLTQAPQDIASRQGALLLQGPVGPFFARLQDHLDASGWDTIKVQFNAGDCLFHGAGRQVLFSGPLERLSAWLEALLTEFGPTVILLFGDQRPIHKVAAEVASRLGIAVVSFEEGYLRPHYITVELGGNNALSSLRNWHFGGRRMNAPSPRVIDKRVLYRMSWLASAYYLALRIGALRFRHYRHHRSRSICREMVLWTRNVFRKQTRRARNQELVGRLTSTLSGQFFLVALQVHDDLQLRSHGRGWTLERMIETAISTFAQGARRQDHLVFKAHPLDRGHYSCERIVTRLARVHGIGDRVHCVCDGNLGLMSTSSRGMLTINSTAALTSFRHAKPVFALGASFYEPLTANGQDNSAQALKSFWRSPPRLRAGWRTFRAEIIQRSQVNGSYYLADEIEATCRRVELRVARLVWEHARTLAPERSAQAPTTDEPRKARSKAEGGRALVPRPGLP